MAKGDKTARRKIEEDRQESVADSIAKYSYFKMLVEKHPELEEFFNDLKTMIEQSETGQITQDEFNAATRNYEYFTNFDSDQQQSNMAQALDEQNNTNLYGEARDELRRKIEYTSRQKGLELNPTVLDELTDLAQFNNFDQYEIDGAIADNVMDLVESGGQASGKAGNVQTELTLWANKNGLNLSNADMAAYVESGAFGGTDLESIKQNIRDTYMAGSYPAWSERIGAGADPYDISLPYRKQMSDLLEIDIESISFNDEMLNKGLQGVGADGKPSMVPLYEYKKMLREDPRWDKTENALKEYTTAGTNILQMFGLR